ncbi:transposase [Sorangium sp. So ce269]
MYVGNHNGYPYMAEAFLFMLGLFNEYGVTRNPYFLIHDLTLKLPLLNQFFTRIGGIKATAKNATRALSSGHSLLIYPGGAPELMRPHRERTRVRFDGRTSHVRLAMKYGVPIVPFVGVGGHSTAMILDDLPWLAEALGAKSRLGINAWPLILSIPWGLTLGPFIPPYIPWPSKIILELLEPMVFEKGSAGDGDEDRVAAGAAKVERTIESALARLEAERMTRKRPPLVAARDAAARLLRWIEGHREDLMRWISAATDRLSTSTGLGEDRRLPRSGVAKEAPRAVEEARHDVEVFRQILARSGRIQAAVPGDRPPLARDAGIRPAAGPTKAAGRGKPRFTEQRIHAILAQASKGKSVTALCRESGISASTFYRWRARHPAKNGADDRAPAGRNASPPAGGGRIREEGALEAPRAPVRPRSRNVSTRA